MLVINVEIENFSKVYIKDLKKIMDNLDIDKIKQIVNIILEAYEKDKQIFIIGNGGSAATASHFCNDLSKLCSVKGKKRFRAISLTDNIPLISAWANDNDYGDIFAEQLKNFLNEGDVVIGVTGSGNSENIIKAIEFAKNSKAKTIAFLGFDGGKLKNIVDNYILISSNHYGLIEDVHLILAHMIANYIKERLSSL